MKLAKALTIFMLTAASLPALSAKTVKVDIDRVNMDIPVRIGDTIQEFRNRLEIAPGHRVTVAKVMSVGYTCDWDSALQACKPCDAVDSRTGQNLTGFRRLFERGNRTDEFADGSTISTQVIGPTTMCTSSTISPVLPEVGTYYNEYPIIGGTGRFAGATGKLVIKGEYKLLWANEAAASAKVDGELQFILE